MCKNINGPRVYVALRYAAFVFPRQAKARVIMTRNSASHAWTLTLHHHRFTSAASEPMTKRAAGTLHTNDVGKIAPIGHFFFFSNIYANTWSDLDQYFSNTGIFLLLSLLLLK